MAISTAPAVDPAMIDRRGEGFSFFVSEVVGVWLALGPEATPFVLGTVLMVASVDS